MEEIFALDIGTRKVMGLLCARKDDRLEIIDMEVIEHTSRCMLDGQIHNIDDVARTVSRIRERLEKRAGHKLEKVGVAVAGRNLTTFKTRVERRFDGPQEITLELLRGLELEAVDRIVSESGSALTEFYCAGYSPVFYEVDSNRLSNPLGHTCRSCAAEIIATFLPRLVLESILTVLKKTGLRATNITLEPISAINAIIPQELRKLNIILVDIGAGTSDLALARDSLVFAYGMVPDAGDEVTESISENLLTEFSAAEKIKRSALRGDEIEYKDMWNRHRRIAPDALRQLIAPAVKKLADSIASHAMSLNGGIPAAVVLVGGGSLTPGLIPELARAFGLPEHKVGIRLPELIHGITDSTGALTGPEAVTPIGIALMTEKAQGLRFIDVEVDGKKVTVLDFEQRKDVLGALTLSGVLSQKKLYARPGLALTYTLNGEIRSIKGTFGAPAKIIRNGQPVDSLSEKIENGDSIEIEGAVDGVDASACLSDVVHLQPVRVYVNSAPAEVMPRVLVGGVSVEGDQLRAGTLYDRAEIAIKPPLCWQALERQGIQTAALSQRQILVNINGSPKILTQRNFSLRLNRESCDLDTELKPDDRLEFSTETPTFYRIRDLIDIPRNREKMRVSVDGRDLELAVDTVQVLMNGQPVNPDEFIIDGADIRVFRAAKRTVMLSEIFRYIEIDPQLIKGKRLRIVVNDAPAGFTTPLSEGARVSISFEER